MNGKMTETDVLRSWLLASPLNFTRYFFMALYKRKFVVGPHHEKISNALQRVLEGKCTRLIINISPRYGKTELAVKNFIAMGLAVNPRASFMHFSYSDDLVESNSVGVKDIIASEAYQDVFQTRIEPGANTKKIWKTSGGGGLYCASTLGQITGFGAGIVEDEDKPYTFGGAIIIDDPIKPEDALSDIKRNAVNRRFENTIRSRLNSRKTPIIVIMQRVHEQDLCGYLMGVEPDAWEVLSLPCINAEGEPLWPFKHSLEELHALEEVDPFVFKTQYMQDPTPIEGLMYPSGFPTYEIAPKGPRCKRRNYTDTADTGADFLCSINYIDAPDGNYVLDVLYTKKPMEYTEQAQADMLARDEIEVCLIESNNGGRGFRRNVERISHEQGNHKTQFRDVPQTANKMTRIFTQSCQVSNITYFPSDWKNRWPQFASALLAFRKEGQNAHDDAPDCLTGCYEHRTKRNTLSTEEILKKFR